MNSHDNPDDLQLLLTWSMPYGKYKGRLIADLPGNYLNWFAREGFPPGKLGQLLALMHELDHNGLCPRCSTRYVKTGCPPANEGTGCPPGPLAFGRRQRAASGKRALVGRRLLAAELPAQAVHVLFATLA